MPRVLSTNFEGLHHARKAVYFDNNATTPIAPAALYFMQRWASRPINPSADYEEAKQAHSMIQSFREDLARYCGVSLFRADGPCSPNAFHMVFTSCSSESNSTAVRSVIDAYWRSHSHGPKPHVVVSAVEHKSVLMAVRAQVELGRATLTEVRPDNLGFLHASDFEEAMTSNTVLVALMAANNETGCVQPVEAVGAIAKRRGALFLCDMVQTFGKRPPSAALMSVVDFFSVSFHKLHGPTGVGLLGVRAEECLDKELVGIVHGTQQHALRGGTENLPGIAGAYAGFHATLEHQVNDAESSMLELRRYLVQRLAARVRCVWLSKFYASDIDERPLVVLVSGLDPSRYLSNTLSLAVLSKTPDPFCNVRMRHLLEKNNIIVSSGSACNTTVGRPNVSHVFEAMGAPDAISTGIIRISLGYQNTTDEVDWFVEKFVQALRE